MISEIRERMKDTTPSMDQIIQALSTNDDVFLSLIREDGTIESANTTMMEDLKSESSPLIPGNFFDLVHPLHHNIFKQAIRDAGSGNQSGNIELYIKNGVYHPMKWQVSSLQDGNVCDKTYLCIGYKILDDDRLYRFNRVVRNHYQLIMEGLGGMILHDQRGELIAANQNAAVIFNTTLESLYKLTDVEQLWNNQWCITDENGVSVPFENAPFRKALQTGLPQKQTLIIQLENGEHRWILFNSLALPEEETKGQFSVISNLIDVTLERQLARQLTAQEALVNSFLQETPQLAWVVDEESYLFFASNSFCRYFHTTEKECLGKKVTDVVPESVTQAVYKNHLEVFETGKSVEVSEKIKWADGSQFIAHLNIFPINGINGKKLVGGQAVITPDKSGLEKDLHSAHERLLHLSRATSDAIWEWDMQTGQIFRNEKLMEMIGYTFDNSKGLSWWLRRIHPDDRNRVADKVKEATDHCQQSWDDEYRFKCADGNYKIVRDKGFVVYENGLPVKMIGSLHDISELKGLEDNLVAARSLQQKEITETVIRVQEKERTRIGYELHDNVNQVLSTAVLFLDMLKTDNKEQRQTKQKTTVYLKIAVEEIRKLSKELVTPKLKEEKLTDSIHILINDIQLAGALKIEFTHDVESNVLSEAKKIALFRIVQEQLKNILKHSAADRTQIFLHSTQGVTELIIEDNGKGFNSQQVHSGIGLSNIRERILFYNGDVNIITSPGKGCKLIVSIPSAD